MVITSCKFVGNTAYVSDALVHNLVMCYSSNASFRTSSDTAACFVLFCTYAFDSLLVAPLPMMGVGQWISQDPSSREIQQQR